MRHPHTPARTRAVLRRGPAAFLLAALLAVAAMLGAEHVADDHFPVQSLIPVGTDPHAFEPTPSDLEKVAGADLVIVNGAGLEDGATPMYISMLNYDVRQIVEALK
ncbi:MAG TPA: zinc ABC transporter substrate-binding protein [Thermoleophilia bacterium]|nr:zinc ABC transporter substrate-binding protein [Thermoleophilia bacterium]